LLNVDGFAGGQNLAAAGIEAIGEMARHLPWGKYQRTLLFFLRATVGKSPAEVKPLIKLTCAIADNYHFNGSGSTADSAGVGYDDDDDKDENEVEGIENNETSSMSVAPAEAGAQDARQASIENTLVNRILPEFYKHLSEKKKGERSTSQLDQEVDGQGIRQSVALTIIKLLMVLPPATLQVQVPRLVAVLTKCLKSHLQSIRDEARHTLVHVAESLGPHYLSFIIEDMRSVLLRGYQRHVLTYTVHTLLLALAPKVPLGALDYCLDGILPILQEELVGALSHEKEVDSLTKKCREFKGGGALDSFRILAEIVTFENVPQLLAPMHSTLATTSSLKVLEKADAALKRIAQVRRLCAFLFVVERNF
jgi:U3 small nucleolar RNA-associated protein 20